MHPTLMTLIADDRAEDLRCAAVEHRRGRLAHAGARAASSRCCAAAAPRASPTPESYNLSHGD